MSKIPPERGLTWYLADCSGVSKQESCRGIVGVTSKVVEYKPGRDGEYICCSLLESRGRRKVMVWAEKVRRDVMRIRSRSGQWTKDSSKRDGM